MNLESLLLKLFPKAIHNLQKDAVESYSELSNNDLLMSAINGYTFYVRGNTEEDGTHTLYKFTPTSMGKNKTMNIYPSGKAKKVVWRDGKGEEE